MIIRRNVLKAGVWAVPAIQIAAMSPVFATSDPTVCAEIIGWKSPGLGHNTKDYSVKLICSGGPVKTVHIYDDKEDRWVVAEKVGPDETWMAKGFNDSRSKRRVMINQQDQYDVTFDPEKGSIRG